MQHLENNNILTDKQHGFRHRRSCESQLITTVHDLALNLDKGKQTHVILLDFSKAFDKVPHQRLLSKFHFYGIQNSTLNWISSFLTNRRQQVTIDNIQSDQLPVDSGVPQGTVLGPLFFFFFFINDLPESVNSEIKLFADDCLMYRTINTHSDAITLQQDINKLEQWENTWQMKLNADKCFTIRITNSRNPIRVDYKIHDQHLNLVPDRKFMGVSLDQTLSWKTHTNNVTAKAYRTLGFLRRNMTG